MGKLLKDIVQEMRGGPYSPDRHMKAHIASAYLQDSNDFLWRVGAARQHHEIGVTSFRAKTCVDLIISVECSLKSLIVALSRKWESAEDAYLTARKLSHHLEKLEKEARTRAKHKVAINWEDAKFLHDAAQLGVKVRYWSDITIIDFMERHVSKPFMPNFIDNTIRDEEWLEKFYILAHDIKQSASVTLKRYFKGSGIMLGSELGNWEGRFQSFIKTIGYK